MAWSLSPNYQSSLVRLLHLSLGPGLSYIPLGKGTALEDGVGQGGTPEQSQSLEGVGPEGGMEVSCKGRTGQASGITLPAKSTAHTPRRSPGRGKRAEGQGEAEARTSGQPHHACVHGQQAEEREMHLSVGSYPREA